MSGTGPVSKREATKPDLLEEYKEAKSMTVTGLPFDDFRALLRDLPPRLSPHGVLVLEIGHERPFFEAAFPQLEVVWLSTSAGDDQVLLLTRATLTTLPSTLPVFP